ncbi:hypothetical protein PROFUN_06185 [Planoprotostelium fungivorum]|uniref:Uncharacterized protein n=1 Tax=Planoprotostelium fungivorum TaxID=1890364 RepID=A0A2P6MYX6_9EUKA|nr:hypothetical protein PROFUN_06185 [Planoprotostelium fungivorum]
MSFSFDFEQVEETGNQPIDEEVCQLFQSDVANRAPAVEIKPNGPINIPSELIEEVDICGVIRKVKRRLMIDVDASSSSERELEELLKTSDLKPGVYEGGFKLWECSEDLIRHLKDVHFEFSGKKVLDLGCGHGLPGLYALKQGAHVHFQDYVKPSAMRNEQVINGITIPNVQLNSKENTTPKATFWAGDWNALNKHWKDLKFDVILTSDTLYNPAYYQRIISIIRDHLSDNGTTYPFVSPSLSSPFCLTRSRIGGSVRQFVDQLSREGELKSERVKHLDDGASNKLDVNIRPFWCPLRLIVFVTCLNMYCSVEMTQATSHALLEVQPDWENSLTSKTHSSFWVSATSQNGRRDGEVKVIVNGDKRTLYGEDGFKVTNWDEKGHNFIDLSQDTDSTNTRFYRPSSSFSIHKKQVNSIDISPLGGLGVSGADDGQLCVWDASNGNVMKTLVGHVGDVLTCQFFPSGQVVLSGASDLMIKIWSPVDGDCAATCVGHSGGILDLGIIDRGRNIVSCSRDGSAKLWEVGSQTIITELFRQNSAVNCCSIARTDQSWGGRERTPDDREYGTSDKLVALGTEDGTIEMIDLRSTSSVLSKREASAINDIIMTSDERMVSAHEDGSVKVWDTRNSTGPVVDAKLSHSPINCLDSSSSDLLYLGTGDGGVYLWDVREKRVTSQYTGSDCEPIREVCVRGGHIYSAARDAKILTYVESRTAENSMKFDSRADVVLDSTNDTAGTAQASKFHENIKTFTVTTTSTGTGVSSGKGDVWHPYVNDPSVAQKILEVLSYLIILAAVPAFLGGVYSCFVMAYGVALGLLGMHAWTRRHSIIFALAAAVFGIYLIVVIILNAIRRVSTVVPDYERTFVGGIGYGTGQFNGSRVFTYIDHGILLILTTLAFFVALKVASERRPEPGTLVHESVTSNTHAPTASTTRFRLEKPLKYSSQCGPNMSLNYERDLWARTLSEGSKIVWDRFKDGKQIMKGMLEFLKDRISYEENFSKSIQKLVKISEKSVEGRSNESIPVCFASMRLQADAACKEHQLFASNLQQSVYIPLKAVREEQSKTHKQLESDIKHLNKDLENQKSLLNKAKSKFHHLSRETEMAETATEKGESENLPPKDIAKLRQKAVASQKLAEAADEIYKTSVGEFQTFQVKYEEEMKTLLRAYQTLEETRNDALKDLMTKYHVLLDAHYASLVESLSIIKAKVDIVDGKADMQSFLMDKQTNQKPPPPVQYEPYIPLNPNRKVVSTLPVYKGGETTVPAEELRPAQSVPNYSNTHKGTITQYPSTTSHSQSTSPVAEGRAPVGMATSSTAVGMATSKTEDYDMPSLPQPRRARANFSYVADEPNELTFKEGDVIVVDKMDPSGWWHGMMGDKKGLFPGNYCDLMGDDEKKVRVTYDFAGQNSDELCVKEGDVLVVENESEGWLLAVDAKGKQGLVPANYTEPL